MTTYVLAGGCFWCLDAVYRRLRGVMEVTSGYTGGAIDEPNYFSVASGTTGHAEAVEVTFDEAIISKDAILDLFFLLHDPTTLNQQGADIGTQYRSALFFIDESQQREFEDAIQRAALQWDGPITTEVAPLTTFYPAEDEHQDYFNKNPDIGYCQIIISPKITKARSAYAQWFKED